MIFLKSFHTGQLHPLKLSTILDLKTTLHIFNNLYCFYNFKKVLKYEYIIAGSSEVPILGYGDVTVQVTRPDKSKGVLRLKDVAFCTDFNTNLVSFHLRQKRGYYGDNNLLVRKDNTILCQMEERHGQQTIEYVRPGSSKSAFNSSRLSRHKRKCRASSRDVRPDSKSDARLWHLRLGYPGPISLHYLGLNALKVKL